jgi:tRNA A-37 threonylcarbamoyl transferase component Bud32
MHDDELSVRLVIDSEPVVEPTWRLGDRWQLSDRVTRDSEPLQGLPVVDDRGVLGVLRFPTKPPSPLHAARLLATIEQYARIEHPHLEPVLDWGVLDGRPWIVVPLEPTRWMRDWLHEDVESWVMLIDKFVGVCRAVSELHRHGLIHGELAPHTFVVDSSGRARVSGMIDTVAQRLADRRPDKASIAADQADLCMAIHGALLAVETTSAIESPSWVLEVIERGFAEHVRDQWPSLDELANHLEHRMRMRSRLVVLRGGAAA